MLGQQPEFLVAPIHKAVAPRDQPLTSKCRALLVWVDSYVALSTQACVQFGHPPLSGKNIPRKASSRIHSISLARMLLKMRPRETSLQISPQEQAVALVQRSDLVGPVGWMDSVRSKTLQKLSQGIRPGQDPPSPSGLAMAP